MTPEQVWQAALGQLQMEMPRASFDNWVRDTRLLSFDNDLITIGCRNVYAADWLENRLSSTVSRLLAGMLNQAVEVQFVASPGLLDSDAEEDQGLDDSSDGAKTLISVDATRYQNEVHPERVVVIPGYTLRLLEQGDVTPRQLSLWLGFRQAVAAWKGAKPVVRKVGNQEAIKFAMMSRAAFFREIEGQDEIAGGLVERIALPDNKNTDSKGRWYQNANTYRVHAMPFLASKDAACIEQILYQTVLECATREDAISAVLARLENMAETDPAEWLFDPKQKLLVRRVLAVVRRVLDIKGDLPSNLADASERVQDRLLAGFGSVVISHYYLLTLAPHLGLSHAQAWAIIALRDRCWYDHETQAQRDFAIVHGGIKALAGWVGASEKSVQRWLSDARFTCLANLMNVPDLPETWKTIGTLVFRVRQLEILVSDLNGQSETPVTDKVRLIPGQSETRIGQTETPVLDKLRLESGQSETLLNNLIKPHFKTSITSETKTTTGFAKNSHDLQSKHVAAVTDLGSWDKTILLNNLRVSPKTRAKLTSVAAWQVISWLLYACSPAGSGIKNPENYALAKAAETRSGAGGDYDDLTRKSPVELVELILGIFEGGETERQAWARAMGSSNDRIQKLLPLLTGVE